MKFLVLEDEAIWEEEIRRELALVDPTAEVVAERSGDSAFGAAIAVPFDCLIFDRTVIGLDGLSVVRKLREHGIETPVLMLSSLASLEDRNAGREGGAEVYLTKPFERTELASCVRGLLRFAAKVGHPEIRLHGRLKLATVGEVAYWDNVDLDLTEIEYRILDCLSINRSHVVSPEALHRNVWPEFLNLGPQATWIQVNMSRLRKKLRKVDADADPIETVPGQGYRIRE